MDIAPSWTQETYGRPAFEGAFVYNISATSRGKPQRFDRLGNISHHTLFPSLNPHSSTCDTAKEPKWATCYRSFDSTLRIRRSLYVGDYLYTISSRTIACHRIDDLSLVSAVELTEANLEGDDDDGRWGEVVMGRPFTVTTAGSTSSRSTSSASAGSASAGSASAGSASAGPVSASLTGVNTTQGLLKSSLLANRLMQDLAQSEWCSEVPLVASRHERVANTKANADEPTQDLYTAGAEAAAAKESAAIEAAAVVSAEAFAERWTVAGLAEHASVAAFARFSLELMSVGAPSTLIWAAHAAAQDEIRHAQLCFGLANAYDRTSRIMTQSSHSARGASAGSLANPKDGYAAGKNGGKGVGMGIGPGPFKMPSDMMQVSSVLVDVAHRALVEGCVHELYSVVDALAEKFLAEHELGWQVHPLMQPARAQELEVLETISDDEAKHTILSWRFLWWSAAEGTAENEAGNRGGGRGKGQLEKGGEEQLEKGVHRMIVRHMHIMEKAHAADGDKADRDLEIALEKAALATEAQPMSKTLLYKTNGWAARHFVLPLLRTLADPTNDVALGAALIQVGKEAVDANAGKGELAGLAVGASRVLLRASGAGM
jgi:hypothetical protein